MQGDALATVYFNVLVARIYRKQLRVFDGRGVLFAVADDVKILGPPEVIKEMAEGFPTLAWEETSLTTHTVKNRIFVQHSAQAKWNHFIAVTPRNSLTELPVHDIPDGSELVDPFDPASDRIWGEENDVNILETPLGSNFFVAGYLRGKGLKHLLLLRFIKDVAAAGFPKEAEQMLMGAVVPRLFHILKSVQMNNNSVGWMKEMDGAHLSAWLQYLTASEDLETDLGPEERGSILKLTDLPASYGGAGLHSFELSADEEFLGSFAGIATALISFCRNTELDVYIKIAEALERMDEPDLDGGLECATIECVKGAYARMGELGEPLSEAEIQTATELVRGSRVVEVPRAYNPEIPDPILELMTLPEPRLLSDYSSAPCKHKCNIIKQLRHAKQAHKLILSLNLVKHTLLRATTRHCGLDSARFHSVVVKEVVKLDRIEGMEGGPGKQHSSVPLHNIVSGCQLIMPE
jgi:hypothetical protein